MAGVAYRCLVKVPSQSVNFITRRTFKMHSRNTFGGRYLITLLPGHGIGPEMTSYVDDLYKILKVPIDFEYIEIPVETDEKRHMEYAIRSIKRNQIALKGNIETPAALTSDKEPRNLKLRNDLDLFVNTIHCRSQPGVKTRHSNIDIVVVRQNSEGEYSRLEHEAVKGTIECLKVITRQKSEQIARFAFQYASTHKRKKVTAIHKANIMKLSDGLFLKCCEEVSRDYPSIKFTNMIIDNCCMQLVSNPNQFDVMVVPNLYGNIVTNVICGLVGGPGFTSGANYSHQYAVFETGTRNTGTNLVGKNIANPLAMIKAGSDVLKHLGLYEPCRLVREAVNHALNVEKVHTKDLGGNATTSDVFNCVKAYVKEHATSLKRHSAGP